MFSSSNSAHYISAGLLAILIVGWFLMLVLHVVVPAAYIELLFAFAGVFTTATGIKLSSASSSPVKSSSTSQLG